MERWLTTTDPASSSDRTREPRPDPIEVVPGNRRRLIESGLASGGRRMVPIVGFGLVFPYFEDDMPTHDEIYQKVQATLVDALGVDEEDVTHDATLQGDLGAESIDFLDIVFRLERNFGIKIPRGELFPENVVTDPDMIKDGKLTAKGLDELKARMPYADLTEFAADPDVEQIGDLYTVDMLVHYVSSKLAA